MPRSHLFLADLSLWAVPRFAVRLTTPQLGSSDSVLIMRVDAAKHCKGYARFVEQARCACVCMCTCVCVCVQDIATAKSSQEEIHKPTAESQKDAVSDMVPPTHRARTRARDRGCTDCFAVYTHVRMRAHTGVVE